jgi:hypothetical protein
MKKFLAALYAYMYNPQFRYLVMYSKEGHEEIPLAGFNTKYEMEVFVNFFLTERVKGESTIRIIYN